MINPLSQKAREIVWGCLFGDGCLRKPSGTYINKDGKRINHYRHYKFQIRHSLSQIEYVNWLYENLKPVCHSEPKIYKQYLSRIQKEYKSVDIVTRTYSYFTRLRGYFYPEGKKVVSRKLLNKLTPLGLAVWHMDDGTTDKKGRVWLATNAFSYEEHKIIQKYFIEVWGLKVSIVKERNAYKIAFNSSSSKFCNIIRPFVIGSMQYKLV